MHVSRVFVSIAGNDNEVAAPRRYPVVTVTLYYSIKIVFLLYHASAAYDLRVCKNHKLLSRRFVFNGPFVYGGLTVLGAGTLPISFFRIVSKL